MVKKRGLERINNVRGDQFPFCTPRHAQLVWSKGVFPNSISHNSLPLEPFVFSLFFFLFLLFPFAIFLLKKGGSSVQNPEKKSPSFEAESLQAYDKIIRTPRKHYPYLNSALDRNRPHFTKTIKKSGGPVDSRTPFRLRTRRQKKNKSCPLRTSPNSE
ncbi:hypothetical protein BDV39DRAFT_167993 [Aspergillus sergii]|uniref:Uncharacterized protein n=1 Tax=Aspergillus sergii TaxID=1034303 RepID=A0A5N6XKC2_9EURO|nr:hypothetical protein BDV39DRAFT_167993 [Aspergillus sergii]